MAPKSRGATLQPTQNLGGHFGTLGLETPKVLRMIELEDDDIIVPRDAATDLADEHGSGPGIGLSPADEDNRLNRLFPNPSTQHP